MGRTDLFDPHRYRKLLFGSVSLSSISFQISGLNILIQGNTWTNALHQWIKVILTSIGPGISIKLANLKKFIKLWQLLNADIFKNYKSRELSDYILKENEIMFSLLGNAFGSWSKHLYSNQMQTVLEVCKLRQLLTWHLLGPKY